MDVDGATNAVRCAAVCLVVVVVADVGEVVIVDRLFGGGGAGAEAVTDVELLCT